MTGTGSEAAWRERVRAYIRTAAQPVDKYGHQPRLYALASKLGEGMAFDDDVLFAAAWMHDLGVFTGHRPSDPEELARWNHVPYTMARTRELLTEWGFPADKLDGVAAAIRSHQAQDEPEGTEAVLLRDADILEQLGAVGVLRTVSKVGRDTRYATYTEVMPVLERAARHLPGQLRLKRSQLLAAQRVAALRAFLEAVREEAGEQLF